LPEEALAQEPLATALAQLAHAEEPWDEGRAPFRSARTKVTRYAVVSDSAMLATEYQERLGNSAAAKAWLAKQDH